MLRKKKPYKRAIWSNDDFDEWKEAMLEDLQEGETEEDLTYERYYEDCDLFLDDERCNLDVEVDGVIIAFAVLGLWDGNHNGSKTFGSNVKNILTSDCEYVEWYCDRYNVRGRMTHHDGTNHIIYRVAKNEEQAESLIDKIVYHGMTEKQFRKATKSLRPYVANVYGW